MRHGDDGKLEEKQIPERRDVQYAVLPNGTTQPISMVHTGCRTITPGPLAGLFYQKPMIIP